LVRIMLLEQLYRAVTILSGIPTIARETAGPSRRVGWLQDRRAEKPTGRQRRCLKVTDP
jgi:hypothetical protein